MFIFLLHIAFLSSYGLHGYTKTRKLTSSTRQIYLVIRMKMTVMMRAELGRKRNGKMPKNERGNRGVMSRLLRGFLSNRME
jgi:hypothetical protein